MRFRRSVSGNSFIDQKRSVDMRSELQTERIGDQRENWHASTLRMTTDRLPPEKIL
jgi:hypothetical protein